MATQGVDGSKGADGLSRDYRKLPARDLTHIGSDHGDVVETELAAGQLQERTAPAAPLDEEHGTVRPADGQRQAGQSHTGTEVKHVTAVRRKFADYIVMQEGERQERPPVGKRRR